MYALGADKTLHFVFSNSFKIKIGTFSDFSCKKKNSKQSEKKIEMKSKNAEHQSLSLSFARWPPQHRKKKKFIFLKIALCDSGSNMN